MGLDTKRIFVNAATGSFVRIATIVLTFITTPILIGSLGKDSFGLFTILATIPLYAGLLDFGIEAGLVKHLTEYSELKNKEGVRQVMTFGLCCYIGLGAIFTPLIYFTAPQIAGSFIKDELIRSTAESAIVLMFLYFVISGVANVFSARLISMHRMHHATLISLFGQIFYTGSILTVLPWRPYVLTAIWIFLAQITLTACVLIAAVVLTRTPIICNPFRIPSEIYRKLLAFGGWMQLNNLSGLVNNETDKFIIAWYLSLASVTPYQIGNKLAGLSRGIPFQLLAALLPAATIMHIGGDRNSNLNFYREMSRALMLLTLFITGFILSVSSLLIHTWIGSDYPEANIVLFALATSFAVNNLTGGGVTMVRASGQPRYEAYYTILSTILNIGLTIVLAPLYGLYGILFGTVIANIIGSIFFMFLVHRIYCFPWFVTIGQWLWRIVVAACSSYFLVNQLQLFITPNNEISRLTGLFILSVCLFVYALCFATSLYLAGFFADREKYYAVQCYVKFRLLVIKFAHL